ncbi:MAG: hypothetical protein IPM98_06245 [Lewinellaceae bacterium]|nr:hypothetical protein [Lewinellaceae bacterium]
MNRIAWFSFLIFFFCSTSLSSQVENSKAHPAKEFTLVRKTAGMEPINGAPVLDHWGRFVGQWSPIISDSLQQYAFRFDNGKSATVPALSHVLYNPEADRLLVYGASVQSHVISEAELNVYTGSGSTVKNLGIVAYIPFKVGMAGSGDIYVAGKTVYEQAVFELKNTTTPAI